MRYAGFWRRFAAYAIDIVLLALAYVLLFGADFDPNLGPHVQQGGLYGLIVAWLYFAGMESSTRQATLGKLALGIRVSDLEGRRIGFGRATGRHFAKFVSAIILYIGFIMAAFTARKQALHDMLAGTLVVEATDRHLDREG